MTLSCTVKLHAARLRQVALSRRVLLFVVAALLALGSLLAARRIAGAFDRQLSVGPLLLVACTITGLAAGARTAWQGVEGGANRSERRLVGWGSSLAVALWAGGCSYPGSRLLDWLIWLPLLTVDQWLRQGFLAARPVLSPRPLGLPVEEQVRVASELGNAPTNRSLHQQTPSPHPSPPKTGESTPERSGIGAVEVVMQEMVRVREADGRDVIRGTLLADFERGQRVATLHVGFCPPLGRNPQIAAAARDFPEAEAKTVQALPHGARIDVRLREAAEEACQVRIDYRAQSSIGPSRAPTGDSRCDDAQRPL